MESIRLYILLNLIVCTNAGGTLKIGLENYRFEVKLGQGDESSTSSTDTSVLADLDYIKNYSPRWMLNGVLNKEEDDETLEINETTYIDWPWQGPTKCFSPIRFRFILCLDYADRYDPSRLCQLARVLSELIELSRDRFTNSVLGRKKIDFGNILGILRDGDIITNPVELEFDDWKGPLRLAVYVACCGGTRFITDRCGDVMSTTLNLWPQSLTKGTQSMRYSMDGKGSLTFSVSANCEKDHYGRSCDVFCKVDNPALEHAFCNSTTGQKSCMKGWAGLGCQTDVDECRGIVCKNSGTCQNNRGTFTCTCPFGTTGRWCEKRYPVCHLQPCQHQGTCLETSAGALCFCMPGFDGQWCHQLESKDDTSRKVTDQGARLLGGNSAIATPKSVRTVVLRGNQNDHKSSSVWHDWYLAIIIGGFVLIAILLVLLFLLYRAKVRQQYKVTIPESTLLPVTPVPKSRVFDNAVYERDDDSGIIQPNTFQIFYESKNITDIINNTNNNNNNKSKDKDKMNNSGVLLNAGALMQNRYDQEGSEVNKDNIKLSSSCSTVKVENTAKVHRDQNKADEKELRPYSVEKVDDFRGTPKNSDEHDWSGQYNVPRNRSEGAITDRWQNIEYYSSPGSHWKSGQKPRGSPQYYPGGYREPRTTQGYVGDVSNSTVERRGLRHEGSYVQYGDTYLRQKDRKRRSEFSNLEKEHEYEDIESHRDFTCHRPTPKPRSVYNVKCETLKKRYAVPGGMLQNRNNDPYIANANISQLSKRRSSEGMVGEQSRWEKPSGNRFDKPRHSEGDISYPYQQGNNYSRCDMKHLPLSLYISPEEMLLMSKSSHNPKNTSKIPLPNPTKPYSEPRLREGCQFPKDDSSDDCVSSSRPKHSTTNSPRGSKFDFCRPKGRNIYRNTDIDGFEGIKHSPKESRSSGRSKNKGESGSFRRRSVANLSSPPKVESRRRKSEVMSEKLFGRKITSELRSDSETSVDKCWWTHYDVQDTEVNNDDSKTLSSSSFV